MPLLGVLGAPVTLACGAFGTTTLLFTLAFPVSALSAYALISRWVRWRPAAFAGGLLYGFSPYLVAQGGSHLNQVFVPLPPLIFLVLDEVASADREERGPGGWPWPRYASRNSSSRPRSSSRRRSSAPSGSASRRRPG